MLKLILEAEQFSGRACLQCFIIGSILPQKEGPEVCTAAIPGTIFVQWFFLGTLVMLNFPLEPSEMCRPDTQSVQCASFPDNM